MTEEITVKMLNTDGKESGTAKFTETQDGLEIDYSFENLPEGEFAMHIHETGLATPSKGFTDADSHWNPSNVEHGHETDSGPHIGDLPNIVVGSDGKVSGQEIIAKAVLSEDAPKGKYSLHNDGNGTTLIVHVGADDYKSQPTGDAGDRQLGGVIVPKK